MFCNVYSQCYETGIVIAARFTSCLQWVYSSNSLGHNKFARDEDPLYIVVEKEEHCNIEETLINSSSILNLNLNIESIYNINLTDFRKLTK